MKKIVLFFVIAISISTTVVAQDTTGWSKVNWAQLARVQPKNKLTQKKVFGQGVILSSPITFDEYGSAQETSPDYINMWVVTYEGSIENVPVRMPGYEYQPQVDFFKGKYPKYFSLEQAPVVVPYGNPANAADYVLTYTSIQKFH